MDGSTAKAENLIKVSAMIVAAVYAYRRFTEGTAEETKASKTIPPLGRFLVGWGVVFLGLSSLAEVWPEAAGNMAILITLGSLLTNGVEISKDLNAALGKAEPATKATAKKGTTGTTINRNAARPGGSAAENAAEAAASISLL